MIAIEQWSDLLQGLRDRLDESLGALKVALTVDNLQAIERAVPKGAAAGDRCAAPLMAHLDNGRTHA